MVTMMMAMLAMMMMVTKDFKFLMQFLVMQQRKLEATMLMPLLRIQVCAGSKSVVYLSSICYRCCCPDNLLNMVILSILHCRRRIQRSY